MDIKNDAYEDNDFIKVFELLNDGNCDGDSRGGSGPGRAPNINRERRARANKLFMDYSDVEAMYPEHIFLR